MKYIVNIPDDMYEIAIDNAKQLGYIQRGFTVNDYLTSCALILPRMLVGDKDEAD